MAEIGVLRKFRLDYVHCADDTFGVNRAYTAELCRAMAQQYLGLNWSCGTTVSLVDRALVRQMREAGCRAIQVGVESGSNRVLKHMRKTHTIEEARAAARIIKDSGMYVQALFVLGYPEETEKTLRETMRAIRTFPCDVVLYNVFAPYPGTERYRYCEEKEAMPADSDVSLFNHHSPGNCFCPAIDKDVFRARLRRLERMVDRINSRRKLRMYSSRDGYLKLKELGLRTGMERLFRFVRHALPRV